jgi:hypothetical protein
MPKKIRLTLETLTVDSFETGATAKSEGTVHALQISTPDPCLSADDGKSCAQLQTRYESCYLNCECTNQFELCIDRETYMEPC